LIACIGVLSLLFSTAADSRDPETHNGPYQVVAPVPGGVADGVWDYATVDNAARRLYLAQDGVTVLELDTGKVTPHFVTGKPFQGLVPTHHVLPVNGGKVLAVSDVAKVETAHRRQWRQRQSIVDRHLRIREKS
jgi:hypothetical protein